MFAYLSTFRRRLLLFVLIPVSIGRAAAQDLILHPDDRTAWMQRNDEFSLGDTVSENHWKITPTIEVVPREGGLRITANATTDGNSSAVIRYMPFDEGYPWLQFNISDVIDLEGYRGFAVNPGGLDTFVRGSVAHLQEGRYVTRVTPDPAKTAPAYLALRMDISGLQFTLTDLCMKSDPLPRLEAHPVDASGKIPEIGDEMKVTVYLADPAEDVSVELFNSYLGLNIRIDGAGLLQLNPEDSEGKIWSGIFALESLDVKPIPKGKPVPAGTLLFKATILGGNFPKPLLTWNEYPWDVNY